MIFAKEYVAGLLKSELARLSANVTQEYGELAAARFPLLLYHQVALRAVQLDRQEEQRRAHEATADRTEEAPAVTGRMLWVAYDRDCRSAVNTRTRKSIEDIATKLADIVELQGKSWCTTGTDGQLMPLEDPETEKLRRAVLDIPAIAVRYGKLFDPFEALPFGSPPSSGASTTSWIAPTRQLRLWAAALARRVRSGDEPTAEFLHKSSIYAQRPEPTAPLLTRLKEEILNGEVVDYTGTRVEYSDGVRVPLLYADFERMHWLSVSTTLWFCSLYGRLRMAILEMGEASKQSELMRRSLVNWPHSVEVTEERDTKVYIPRLLRDATDTAGAPGRLVETQMLYHRPSAAAQARTHFFSAPSTSITYVATQPPILYSRAVPTRPTTANNKARQEP